MRIENEILLDFDDVLIKPKRSEAPSRSSVDLTRQYHFLHSDVKWKGIPLIAANMSTTGTISMARVLSKLGAMTCLHKFYDLDVLENFYKESEFEGVFYTLGIKEEDIDKLKQFLNRVGNLPYICIDAANGYTKYFVDKVREVRKLCPKSVIMAGNVCTAEMVQELILSGGAELIKIGTGPGCFISGTKVITEHGKKNIENVKVGDKVLTHDGTFKIVTNTMSRLENKRIIDINGIKCTPNHEFYVIHKKDKEFINQENIHKYAKWISAEELDDNYLLIKITN